MDKKEEDIAQLKEGRDCKPKGVRPWSRSLRIIVGICEEH